MVAMLHNIFRVFVRMQCNGMKPTPPTYFIMHGRHCFRDFTVHNLELHNGLSGCARIACDSNRRQHPSFRLYQFP